MKIICSDCKKIIGEKAPYKSSSVIKAKCTDCIAKEEEAALTIKPLSVSKDGQEVTLESGIKGILWAVKTEHEKLSAWELGLSGRKFFCAEKDRGQFQKQLEQFTDEQFDISFFHSLSFTLPSQPRGRKKKEVQATTDKQESTQYNCTVKVNRQIAQSMYDGKVEQFNNIIELLLQAGKTASDNMSSDDIRKE